MINFCIGLLVGLFGINLIDSLNNILAQVTKHICTKIAYKDYLIEKENYKKRSYLLKILVV